MIFGLPALKASLWGNALLGALLVLTFTVQQARVSTAQLSAANSARDLAEANRAVSAEREQFQVRARESERTYAAGVAAAQQMYLEETNRAQAESEKLVAHLRDGTVRLRQQWQGCVAAARVPEAADSVGGPDAAANDRTESAGRIVRAAAGCDAQVRGLQAVIKSWSDE